MVSDWRCFGRSILRSFPPAKSDSRDPPYLLQKGPAGHDINHEDFFRCSTKRWLYNEEKQLALRYVRFNVPALQKVAAEAVGAKHCVSIVKTAEGSFNKIFSLCFDNGAEAIVKIPCPMSGPTHLAVASEVATLDFVHTRMQIPVPRVLAWSSGKPANDVGTAYIIMEKLNGVPLYDRWLEIERKHVVDFMHKTIAYEKSFSDFRFSQIGSLYFKEDVDPVLQERRLYAEGVPDDDASDRFRIGPTLQREFWRDGRIDMHIDRGPWPDTRAYALAIANCERLWLQTHAHPCAPDDPFRVFDEGCPTEHMAMLDRFMSVVHLIIRAPDIFQPTLWHTDLHESNIIVKPDGSPDVLGIIDWQEWIGPKFLRASFPRLFIYDGHMVDLNAAEGPRLPDYFEELTANRKAEAQLQLELAGRHRVYTYYIRRGDPAHAQILTDSRYSTLCALFRCAGRTWSDGLTPLRQALIEVAADWETFAGPGVACPLTFTNDELQNHARLHEQIQRYESRKRIVENILHLGPDGLVEPDQYESVRVSAERACALWVDERDGGPWPLQDGGWSSLF